MKYILLIFLAYRDPLGGPTLMSSMSAEFDDLPACEAAVQAFKHARQTIADLPKGVGVCIPKSSAPKGTQS